MKKNKMQKNPQSFKLVDPSLIQGIITNCGGSVSKAARALGVTNYKFARAVKGAPLVVNGDIDIDFIPLLTPADVVASLGNIIKPIPEMKSKDRAPRDTKKTAVDIVLHISDIHYGANQDGDEIEGINYYDIETCRSRMYTYARRVLEYMAMVGRVYDVRDVHVLCTGDFISGDIQDLRVTNDIPSPAQAVECGQLLASILGEYIYPQTRGKLKIHLVTDDNHGRLTKKPQARQGGVNNWSYVVGHWVKEGLSKLANVEVNVINRMHGVVECADRKYLLTHGHHFRGFLPGVEKAFAREAVQRMNMPANMKFHKIVMGHYHIPVYHPQYIIGGSVSGTDAYDHSCGRHSPAKQTAWTIIPKEGERFWTEFSL